MGVSDKQTSGRNTEKARPSGGGSLAVLRRPVFLMLFVAQLVSNIGSWMQSVGAQWFLVEQAGSPALVAWVQTAGTLPVLLLSLFAGVAADLVNRKRLLLTLSLVSAAIAVALTVVTAAGWLGPWELLGFTFILGCAAAIMGPAWQAIQPELVPREELPQASSLGSITVNGARAIGPAIAGIIVVASGPAMVFGINAVSFLAVALALVLWRRGTQQSRPCASRCCPGCCRACATCVRRRASAASSSAASCSPSPDVPCGGPAAHRCARPDGHQRGRLFDPARAAGRGRHHRRAAHGQGAPDHEQLHRAVHLGDRVRVGHAGGGQGVAAGDVADRPDLRHRLDPEPHHAERRHAVDAARVGARPRPVGVPAGVHGFTGDRLVHLGHRRRSRGRGLDAGGGGRVPAAGGAVGAAAAADQGEGQARPQCGGPVDRPAGAVARRVEERSGGGAQHLSREEGEHRRLPRGHVAGAGGAAAHGCGVVAAA
ncbi:Hypothetical protein PFCIRM129_12145 [Propionibacterium freudenreichii subsp. freudenreichii]|uniref:MFS transporter n=1 Tax=Propionibacterium freudenreichii subsp. shermanii (strain ATCC 9614 / DSM 4902 / CIP 103027 / NCIMB 8099 / CIRM-BIA1) TaxID=754252 RepID=D7GH41_PROFC|nr:Hypothetical protein PFREUD_23380 [Propionibacterium freudenreichii subsp. shermanii CIRM-BIA1]CDP49479.1 Hypothetical protein PFCIRM129_12145 [Propionibacterium freudenreichii subsp. freudenreichii]